MGFCYSVFSVLASGSILQTLDGLRRGIVNSKLGEMSYVATVVAALLCGAVFLKISHDYLSGKGITLWDILRPLVLLLLCANFNTFVAGPLHATCNLMTASMSRSVDVSGRQVMGRIGASIRRQFDNSQMAQVQNFGQTVEQIKTDLQREPAQNSGFWDKIKTGAGNVVMAVTHAVTGIEKARLLSLDFIGTTAIVGILESVLYWIMRLVMFGQQVYCYIYLSILTLIGPFAFALGVYPGFSHSVTSWIGRYVQICFWIPIGQLVMYCNYWMLDTIASMGVDAMFGDKWLMVAASLVCIMNVSAVPQIASFVVESAGDSGAMGSANASIRETFQTAMSIKTVLKK